MGKFEFIEYTIIKNPNIYYDVYYRMIFKVNGVKYRDDMMTNEKDILTEKEFIKKIKKQWHDLKELNI